MENFESVLPQLLLQLKKTDKVFLMSDFDGTLSPLAASPGIARLPRPTYSVLKDLSKNKNILIAIISGRVLKDIKKKIGIKNIIYVGNHGLEMAGPGIKFIHKKALSARPALQEIKKRIKKIKKDFKGLLIEDKSLSLSIHYRRVKQGHLKNLHNIFREITRPFCSKNKIRVFSGKKVFEIMPPVKWGKQEAVNLLVKRYCRRYKNFIYLGDDRTDEDAFRALRKKGITVRVGGPKKNSLAKFYLKDSKAVLKFLKSLETAL